MLAVAFMAQGGTTWDSNIINATSSGDNSRHNTSLSDYLPPGRGTGTHHRTKTQQTHYVLRHTTSHKTTIHTSHRNVGTTRLLSATQAGFSATKGGGVTLTHTVGTCLRH